MHRYDFIKFLMVGVINTIIGITVMFIGLNLFHFNYWLSTFIGNSVGALVSYLLNKQFTFQSDVPVTSSAVRFLVVILACYFVAYKIGLDVAQWMLSNWSILPSHYQQEVAVIMGSGLYTVLNYFGQKFIVFNRRK